MAKVVRLDRITTAQQARDYGAAGARAARALTPQALDLESAAKRYDEVAHASSGSVSDLKLALAKADAMVDGYRARMRAASAPPGAPPPAAALAEGPSGEAAAVAAAKTLATVAADVAHATAGTPAEKILPLSAAAPAPAASKPAGGVSIPRRDKITTHEQARHYGQAAYAVATALAANSGTGPDLANAITLYEKVAAAADTAPLVDLVGALAKADALVDGYRARMAAANAPPKAPPPATPPKPKPARGVEDPALQAAYTLALRTKPSPEAWLKSGARDAFVRGFYQGVESIAAEAGYPGSWVPAFVTAHACWSSGWGRSVMTQLIKNAFGMKTPAGYTGKVLVTPAQPHDVEKGSIRYRVFDSFADCVRAYFELLSIARYTASRGVLKSGALTYGGQLGRDGWYGSATKDPAFADKGNATWLKYLSEVQRIMGKPALPGSGAAMVATAERIAKTGDKGSIEVGALLAAVAIATLLAMFARGF